MRHSETREFEKEYDEEAHLFGVVGPRFREKGRLDAYDFFLIVRWKANRAIRRVARRLVSVGGPDLEKAVSQLSGDVFRAKDARTRLLILMDKWHLRLPMASAILTVLYPDEFTVYDARACEQLKAFHNLGGSQNAEELWSGYLEFKAAVERATPPHLSLRDKDRFLWAQSRHKALVGAIERRFGILASDGAAQQPDAPDERRDASRRAARG